VASRSTPVAHDAADVTRLAGSSPSLTHLDGRVSVCRACPRLVAWREQVAADKRAAYAGERYWGRPVTGFGEPRPRIVILGLAPAAHGGNRTGRIFTGDRSGDWLFAALHRAGLASQPTSTSASDGLRLHRTRLLAAVRCAPPANKPTTVERDTCAPWLHAELRACLPSSRVVLALGQFAWQAAFPALAAVGCPAPVPRVAFGHGALAEVRAPHRTVTVLGCYHPSQQNTFTGKLTEQMLDDVLAQAVALAG
jgi:uracil-DNA glycosylase family 4